MNRGQLEVQRTLPPLLPACPGVEVGVWRGGGIYGAMTAAANVQLSKSSCRLVVSWRNCITEKTLSVFDNLMSKLLFCWQPDLPGRFAHIRCAAIAAQGWLARLHHLLVRIFFALHL